MDASDESTRTNLVAPASSFVGRRRELDELGRLFEGDARLVTLVGPGGIGKTRLATRYAEGKVNAYSQHGGGVWFVDLSDAKNKGDAVTAVGRAVGMAPKGSADDASVGRRIAHLGRALLVLDNVEHLAIPVAPMIEGWVRRAPSARFVVTSRAALECDAEHVLAVGPLVAEDATELFRRRAKQVLSAPLDEDDADIAGIIGAVDGIPLAIELAASRMRVLSLRDLRARLARPLEILRGSKSAARHGSMEHAVLDSVALLSPEHQRLFALASSMQNGFTMADAEAVVGGIALPREMVLDGIEDLVRTSLLRVFPSTAGATRYGFFRTIREVAESVDADDRRAAAAAQSAHFASLWDADRVFEEPELENQLLAHARALKAGNRRDATTIVLGLEPWLSGWGLSSALLRLFDETLAVADDEAETVVRLHLGRGLARREVGHTEEARRDFERSVELLEATEWSGLKAVALTRLGDIEDIAGHTRRAREHCLDAMDLLSKSADDDVRRDREANVLLLLGHAFRREGHLERARDAIDGAITRFRALAKGERLAAALYERCVIEMFGEEAAAALATAREGIEVARKANARVVEGTLIVARGALLQEDARFAEALEAHAEGARIFGALDSRYREASALYYLASAYAEFGELDEALSVLRQAEKRIEIVGSPHYETLIGSCRASVLAMMHRRDGRPMEDAQEAMNIAIAALAHVPDEPALAAAVAVHGLIVSVAAGGDVERALREAEPLVKESSNDDSRYALRLLRSLRGDSAAATDDALIVWPEGAAFSPPGSDARTTLPEGSPLRRILHHLAQQRIDAPGAVVNIDELITAGWPDEKIRGDSALNRAYVALSALRKKGLRGILLRVGGGYALSQSVVVRRGTE